jgi:hypothetical protein
LSRKKSETFFKCELLLLRGGANQGKNVSHKNVFEDFELFEEVWRILTAFKHIKIVEFVLSLLIYKNTTFVVGIFTASLHELTDSVIICICAL